MNGSKFYCVQLARADPGFSVWDTGPRGGCPCNGYNFVFFSFRSVIVNWATCYCNFSLVYGNRFSGNFHEMMSCLAQAKFWLQKAPVPHSHFGIQWRNMHLLILYIVESINASVTRNQMDIWLIWTTLRSYTNMRFFQIFKRLRTSWFVGVSGIGQFVNDWDS